MNNNNNNNNKRGEGEREAGIKNSEFIFSASVFVFNFARRFCIPAPWPRAAANAGREGRPQTGLDARATYPPLPLPPFRLFAKGKRAPFSRFPSQRFVYLPLNSIKRDARGVAQGRRHCQEGCKQKGDKDRCRYRGGQGVILRNYRARLIQFSSSQLTGTRVFL